ncbi:preprotein translocase subunit YajC [Ornithobacterium rhinotracheale]|uniref:preprotein translocase subunit YajC n=1 Tax=Ornithobacterium rhinotracheale TaxID=28251 RepID=UPI001FF5B59F|nr:preprotein translocase subunit YajC [Ornithobacterium rhinotracheale]MCK0199349.1 preprotein translocase subunit YajC [Ornithobacterium rhinotracheale]
MGGDGMMSLVFFGLMFVIMYFFMIRPQVQKQKRERKFQESLDRGARIVTTSGIHGKVVEINGDIVTVETGAGKIRFEKTAISQELTAARYGNAAREEEKK